MRWNKICHRGGGERGAHKDEAGGGRGGGRRYVVATRKEEKYAVRSLEGEEVDGGGKQTCYRQGGRRLPRTDAALDVVILYRAKERRTGVSRRCASILVVEVSGRVNVECGVSLPRPSVVLLV